MIIAVLKYGVAICTNVDILHYKHSSSQRFVLRIWQASIYICIGINNRNKNYIHGNIKEFRLNSLNSEHFIFHKPED